MEFSSLPAPGAAPGPAEAQNDIEIEFTTDNNRRLYLGYTLAEEAGMTGYWRNLYVNLYKAESLEKLKEEWEYCYRVADRRSPYFRKIEELKNLLKAKWAEETARVINVEMAPLLNRTPIWFEKPFPSDPVIEAYMHGGATSADDLYLTLGLGNEQAGSLALYKAQTFFKSTAYDYFNEVVTLMRRKVPDFTIPFQVWLPLLSETAIHIMLVGETGSGKSLLAQLLAVVRGWTGQVIIFDPHAIQPDDAGSRAGDWGTNVIGAGRAYSEINTHMGELLEELSRRYKLRKDGVEAFENLSIFIDEWPSIKANCLQAAEFMKTLAREGRKVNMRLVILSQSALVESLGLRGEGDTRDNFSILHLGKFARKLTKSNWPEAERIYVLDWTGSEYTLNGQKLPEVLAAFRNRPRPYQTNLFQSPSKPKG
jgi:hypothetical protein